MVIEQIKTEVYFMSIKDILEKNSKAKKKANAKKTAKNIAIGAGIGSAIGVAAGMLLAPDSGKNTRAQIAKGAKNSVEAVKNTVVKAKTKISSLKNDSTESKSDDSSDVETKE